MLDPISTVTSRRGRAISHARCLAVAVASVAALMLLAATPASAGSTKESKRGHGCTITARATWNSSANTYNYSGSASCNSTRFMKVWCFPVHRHSFNWHSHTHDIVQNGPRRTTRLSSGSASNIRGTNGDRYKINCKLELDKDSGRRVVVETGSFNL